MQNNSLQSRAQPSEAVCNMNRYSPERTLERLVRGTMRSDSTQRDIMARILPNNFDSTISSYIKRFIDIDCHWRPDQITRSLEREETQLMDTHISRLQKVIDDNAPEPGLSRMKELRRGKARQSVSAILGPILAARALRQLEHDLNLVTESGVERLDMQPDGLQYLEDKPFNQDWLMARRNQRIKDEKRADALAIKEFRDRAKAAIKSSKSLKGHWEFENEEEEAVGRVFMRKASYEGSITAEDVFSEQLLQKGEAIILRVQLKWVGNDEIGDSKRKKRKLKAATTRSEEDWSDWDDAETKAMTKALPRKSLVVVLPVDFSKLNQKKRKNHPASDAMSSPEAKKAKKTACTAAQAELDRLHGQIQELTTQWLRELYADPAMSAHSGTRTVDSVEDCETESDSSGLSQPPDDMDFDD